MSLETRLRKLETALAGANANRCICRCTGWCSPDGELEWVSECRCQCPECCAGNCPPPKLSIVRLATIPPFTQEQVAFFRLVRPTNWGGSQ